MDVVESLFERGEDINALDLRCHSPLNHASHCGQFDIA